MILAANHTARIAIRQLTDAMRARELLERARMSCSLVRLRPGEAPGGCAWGLELPARELHEAARMLEREGIRHHILEGLP